MVMRGRHCCWVASRRWEREVCRGKHSRSLLEVVRVVEATIWVVRICAWDIVAV